MKTEIIKKKILVEEMNKLLSESGLTEEDAIKLGRKVNKSVAKSYLRVE